MTLPDYHVEDLDNAMLLRCKIEDLGAVSSFVRQPYIARQVRVTINFLILWASQLVEGQVGTVMLFTKMSHWYTIKRNEWV